mmetsp:Transcript_57598/g.106460  ORF Transcript_57598/g.106460 Transcript_57598/m.106460 type:complete len:190 (+) Transcript_57598:74-643(+)
MGLTQCWKLGLVLLLPLASALCHQRAAHNTSIVEGVLNSTVDVVSCQEVADGANRIFRIVQDLEVLEGMYTQVLDSCASGKHNLDCLTKAASASDPPGYLKQCDAALGPHPTSSGAVCRFAKVKLSITTQFREARIQLAQAMKLQSGSARCVDAPRVCVEAADSCLQKQDAAHCFRECLRLGTFSSLTL